MKNKAWFFGDSFTFGHGCRPGYEYYEKYPELRESTWTDLISAKLNLEQVNKGIPGNSNPFILKQVIENLNNFNQGDIIFLSGTLPIRLVYPSRESKTIVPITTDIIIWPENNKEGQPFVSQFLKDKKEKRVVIDFIHQAIIGKETAWSNFYNEQYEHIQNFLHTLGIEVYTWPHEIWVAPGNYEWITKATKGEVEDGHWSWKGHKDFYTNLFKRVEKKEYKYKPPLI